jgi:hypothetical protein
MKVQDVARESGESRPTPAADFDGQTRAAAMRLLLEKADAPPAPKGKFLGFLAQAFGL